MVILKGLLDSMNYFLLQLVKNTYHKKYFVILIKLKIEDQCEKTSTASMDIEEIAT